MKVIQDRNFWIYFIITLFFIILGIYSISSITGAPLYIISLLWTLSILALFVLIYYATTNWGAVGSLCDSQRSPKDFGKTMILFLNILFITILIFSVLWASEVNNTESSLSQSIYGILILLGGLLISKFSFGKYIKDDTPLPGSPVETYLEYTSPLFVSIIYILIWISLILYHIL